MISTHRYRHLVYLDLTNSFIFNYTHKLQFLKNRNKGSLLIYLPIIFIHNILIRISKYSSGIFTFRRQAANKATDTADNYNIYKMNAKKVLTSSHGQIKYRHESEAMPLPAVAIT